MNGRHLPQKDWPLMYTHSTMEVWGVGGLDEGVINVPSIAPGPGSLPLSLSPLRRLMDKVEDSLKYTQ